MVPIKGMGVVSLPSLKERHATGRFSKQQGTVGTVWNLNLNVAE